MQIAIVQIFCEQSSPFCHKLQILLILEHVNLDIQAFLEEGLFYLCNDASLRHKAGLGWLLGWPLAWLRVSLLFFSIFLPPIDQLLTAPF